MIHVQIAGQLGTDGVGGIRWVLVEPSEAAPPAAAAPAALTADSAGQAADPPVAAAVPHGLGLWLLKSLVIALGLVAALAMSRWQFGAPTVRWWGLPGHPAAPQTLPQPAGSEPALPAPASPASGASLVVKAVLR